MLALKSTDVIDEARVSPTSFVDLYAQKTENQSVLWVKSLNVTQHVTESLRNQLNSLI